MVSQLMDLGSGEDEVSKSLYNILKDNLLSGLPPREQDHLLAVEQKIIIQEGHFDSYYEFSLNDKVGNIMISVPPQFINTPLVDLLKLHELFHVAQYRGLRAEGHSLKSIGDFLQSQQGFFLEEMGAMAMEWSFISKLSTQEKKLILKDLKNFSAETESDKYFKEFLEKSLSFKGNHASEYIQMKHRFDIYSRDITQYMDKTMKKKKRQAIGALVAAGMTLEMVNYCSMNRGQESQLYKILCLKYFFSDNH